MLRLLLKYSKLEEATNLVIFMVTAEMTTISKQQRSITTLTWLPWNAIDQLFLQLKSDGLQQLQQQLQITCQQYFSLIEARQ